MTATSRIELPEAEPTWKGNPLPAPGTVIRIRTLSAVDGHTGTYTMIIDVTGARLTKLGHLVIDFGDNLGDNMIQLPPDGAHIWEYVTATDEPRGRWVKLAPTVELPEVGRHVVLCLTRPSYARNITGVVTAATFDGWGTPLIHLDDQSTPIALWADDTWTYPKAPAVSWLNEPSPQVGAKITIHQFLESGPYAYEVKTATTVGIVESAQVRHYPSGAEFLAITLVGDDLPYQLDKTCPGEEWEYVTTNDDIRRLIEVKRLIKEKDAELKVLKAEEEGLHKSISDSWAEEGQTGAKIGGYTAYLLNSPHVEHSGTDAVLAALLADKLKHLVVTTYHAGAVKSYLADLAKEGQDPPEHLAKVAKLTSGYKIGLRRS